MRVSVMYDFLAKSAKVAAVLSTILAPAPLLAGSYGAAERDRAVANTAAKTPTVPCARLGQNVPANLAAQMDCGSATPEVAGERVRNRIPFFDRFRHDRQAPPPNRDNDDTPPRTRIVSNDPTPTPTPPTGDPDGPDTPDGPTTSSLENKWNRLNELGVTRENFNEQPESFMSQLRDHYEDEGLDGDWSQFNPD